MRKIIMMISVLCVSLLTIEIFIHGIGILNINGIRDISEKDKMVDIKISELDDCVNNEYKSALAKLNSTYDLFLNSKNEYNQQTVISSLNKSSYASQTERYNVDYLLTKIGKYAEEEDVIIKTIITPSEAIENFYHLNVMVWGTYLYTANFIYDIENDSKLGFKIDNFKMVPYYVDEAKYKKMDETTKAREMMQDKKIDVICTFTCKDIPIKDLSLDDDTFLTKDMFEVKSVEQNFESGYLTDSLDKNNANGNIENPKENGTTSDADTSTENDQKNESADANTLNQ